MQRAFTLIELLVVIASIAILAVVLFTGPGTKLRLARAEVREMRPGTVSIMPAGLDKRISRQDLADLLAFLKNSR